MQTFTISRDQHQQIVLSESGEYIIKLTEPGASVEVLSAFFGQKDDNFQLKLTILHQAPHTSANTIIRAVLTDSSIATIEGTIIVDKIAQQTASYLQENVLLMSNKAKANAIPNLEILANDVKCSHAATVGKIPDEHLFYLESRGLPEKAAQKIIADGFLSYVTNKVNQK